MLYYVVEHPIPTLLYAPPMNCDMIDVVVPVGSAAVLYYVVEQPEGRATMARATNHLTIVRQGVALLDKSTANRQEGESKIASALVQGSLARRGNGKDSGDTVAEFYSAAMVLIGDRLSLSSGSSSATRMLRVATLLKEVNFSDMGVVVLTTSRSKRESNSPIGIVSHLLTVCGNLDREASDALASATATADAQAMVSLAESLRDSAALRRKAKKSGTTPADSSTPATPDTAPAPTGAGSTRLNLSDVAKAMGRLADSDPQAAIEACDELERIIERVRAQVAEEVSV